MSSGRFMIGTTLRAQAAALRAQADTLDALADSAESSADDFEAPMVRALLDRQGLARALGVSLGSLDRLRKQAGFPELRLGDSARFELDAVVGWVRGRRDRGGLRVVVGAEG